MKNIIPLVGDILIKIKHKGRYINSLMFRVAFNNSFIEDK